MNQITISLNGKKLTLIGPVSLATLLMRENFIEPFAIAINSNFIAKQFYSTTILKNQDKIDVVVPVVGG